MDSSNNKATFRTAIEYLDKGIYGRAEGLLRDWVVAHPKDMYAHMELIWCFYQRDSDFNRWKKCDAFYDEVFNAANSQTVQSFKRAEQHYYDEENQDAIRLYRKAIDVGCNHPVLHHSIANALVSIGSKEDAKKELMLALSMDPQFLPSALSLGQKYFYQGRFNSLLDIVDAFDNVPEELLAGYRKGHSDLDILLHLGKAARTLQHSVKLRWEGDYSKAIENLIPVIRKHPENCWLIRTVVYLLHRANWLMFGKPLLTSIITEDSPQYFYLIGLFSWYEDEYTLALEAYNSSINKGLHHPLVYLALSLIHDELDDQVERETSIESALAEAPWCLYARSELAEIKLEQGNNDEVLSLTQLTEAEYSLSEVFDISGKTCIAHIQTMTIQALLASDSLHEAIRFIDGQLLPTEYYKLRVWRSRALVKTGALERAAEELTLAVKNDYDLVGWLNEDAIQVVHQVAEACPEAYGPSFILALRPAYDDNAELSLRMLRELLEHYPNDIQLLYHYAKIAWINDDLELAKNICSRVVKANSEAVDVVDLLCTLLANEDDIPALRQLSDQLGGVSAVLEPALECAKRNGDLELAIELAEDILRIDSNNFVAVKLMLDQADPEGTEFLMLLDRLTSNVPIDFRGRFAVAGNLLLASNIRASRERYIKIFSEDYQSMHHILLWSIATLADLADEAT